MNTVADMESVNIVLPVEDFDFLKVISDKMGWITTLAKGNSSKKSELDLALEDVKNGNVVKFSSVDEAIAYLND